MSVNFREQQARNARRTTWLIAGFGALFLATGGLIGWLLDTQNWQHSLPLGIGIGAAVALVSILLAFWFGGDMVLAVSGARRVRGDEGLEERRLMNIVEEMRLASGLPMPRVYIMEDPSPNAFACGRNEQVACVAVTRGLLRKLNRDEVQAVVAHEMGHIRNRDILYTVMLAALIGALVIAGEIAYYVAFASGRGHRRSSSSSGGRDGGGAVLIFFAIAIALFIVGRLLAPLIFFAVSREREYLADSTAVEFTRNPQALANALSRIAGDPAPMQKANNGTAHLFFTNPVQKASELKASASSAFATHPPIAARIKLLREMAGAPAVV